jgi:succinate dehydrogenase/fumarate reductase flavoprotein subunit
MAEVMYDLLVIGGGMAGLSAAASVAGNGGSVVLVDRAPALGGSAMFAGYVWTAPSVDVLREVNPDGDPSLAATLVDGFPSAIDWIRSLGVEVRPPVTLLRYGRGHQVDMQRYLRTCEAEVRRTGNSELLLGTRTERLLQHEGQVNGAIVTDDGGERREILARSTLLASGGFQGDRELVGQRLHPQGRSIPLRSNPYSGGEGLRLGVEAGGTFGPEQAGFYGHLVPHGVPLVEPALFTELALYYSEHGLLLNLNGERFVDETEGDHLSTMAVLAQPEARALLVADQRVYDEWIVGSYAEGIAPMDKFAACRRHGARCAVANDLEEFDYVPPEWGYLGPRLREVLEDSVREPSNVAPGRRFDPLPLDKPPYYIVEVQPAITFTFGGLLIDSAARVLGGDGQPVPGLFAAGADAGGLYVRAYAGGLAAALVFGLRAAESALAERVS